MKIRFILKKIILLATLCSLIISCATTKKIEALKPEPDDASPIVYDTTPSYISLPITLQVSEITHQANKHVNGLIYEDNNIADDNIMLKVGKQAAIEIVEKNSKLEVVVPLKIWVKVRYGKTVLGVDLYDEREINLNGKVNLVSDIAVVNWKLKSTTQLKNIDWQESPSINLAGKNVPITPLINPTIRVFRKDIEKAIDQAIENAVDLKPQVVEGLEKLSSPIEINKEMQMWFQIMPTELYATESTLKRSQIHLDLALKCKMETFIGKKPDAKFQKEKIALKTAGKVQDKIVANIAAISSYTDAARIINSNFKGQVFGDDKRKITIQNVNLWHKNGKIIVALDVVGSLNGSIYLSGVPKYNKDSQEIYFDELDYVLDTKNRLIKSANWLAQGIVLHKMKELCKYSIAQNLTEAEKNIKPYLTNYSPVKGIYVNGNLSDINFNKIQLTNNAIIVFVNANGNVSIKIDGLD
ncbi:MAG: DUF4403 family protein [Flavobacteriales bacterium]|nr:DUF4403 family protein [Flavobacteriales bacterium]